MNPLDMLGGGGLSVSPSATSGATGGTQNNGISQGNSFYSPFAVGEGATATASSGSDKTILIAVGIAAAAAVAIALFSATRRR